MLSASWMSCVLQRNSGCLHRLGVIDTVILFVFLLLDSSCQLFDEEVVAHLAQIVLLCIVFKINSEVMGRIQTAGNYFCFPAPCPTKESLVCISTGQYFHCYLFLMSAFGWKYCFLKSSSLHAHLVSRLLSLIVCKSKLCCLL